MILKVNAHLHTPYSFSAFQDIDEALDRAAAEEVKVVGINDFTPLRDMMSGLRVVGSGICIRFLESSSSV